MNYKLKHILRIFMFILIIIFLCEFLIYYVVIYFCFWPQTPITTQTGNNAVSLMILSDTHLLGQIRGHWLDKLRREWQMYRSFRTSIAMFSPQIVIILGDLFDEGLWANERQFDAYVQRFNHIFSVDSSRTKLYVVVGNHDIGFHYWTDGYLRHRFDVAFNTSSVDLISLANNVNFVRINSMAMEGDECYFCEEAAKRLKLIGKQLSASNSSTAPIVLMHFPLYRESEHVCTEPDSAPIQVKNIQYRVKYDCLSKEATNQILSVFKPRLIFSGHSHHSCVVEHNNGIKEWTVASFSWRNKKNPSFLLALISSDFYVISKCFLPNENTVFAIYFVSLIIIIIYIIFAIIRSIYKIKSE